MTSGKPLVIVESPAKARTIGGLLGGDFVVESSVGHIRDLPRNADEVPASYRNEAWARRLGVDVDNGFKPLYIVAPEKKQVVAKLKKLVADATEVFLATDEDREGEAIAWHLVEVLSPRVPVKRMVFHEITRPAIERAVNEWRDLDRRLVDAQEARRILDRLYGFEVSPVLWRKVMPSADGAKRLSAGRVQSVATRMVVERERARMRFRSATWWDLEGTFATATASETFGATLVSLGGTALATGRDFSETGELVQGKSGVRLLAEIEARALADALEGRPFEVRSVAEKPYRRSPAAPFMTSTLQQEASRKLRFGAQRAMQVAQRLYEAGWITYMRTDSTTLSDEALAAARAQAVSRYGPNSVPAAPRRYERKVKNAQEAHEAIRPAGETFRTPEEAARALHGDELRLYELVWQRTVASQMADATGTTAQVRLVGRAEGAGAEEAEFAASGTVVTFPGFLQVYVEGSDDSDGGDENSFGRPSGAGPREVRLPALREGDGVSADAMAAKGHDTQPPPRYTEASLVKALEELGVGRPSTYASIISTIQGRGYVWKKGSALVPSFVAFAVIALLERYFTELVDYGFTASMEDDLDEIAGGRQEALPWLTRFYFGEAGNGHAGLRDEVASHMEEIDAREINSIAIGNDSEGRPIVVRVGRYGPYLQRGEDERANLPDDVVPDELTIERAEAFLQAPSGDRVLGTEPATGLSVVAKAGRFGPFVQLVDPNAEANGAETGKSKAEKLKTASLFKSMALDTITLDDALELLSLPRVVGIDPESGVAIEARNGRFGPYLSKGNDTRSLEEESQLLTVTLEDALVRFAAPKTRRGRGAAAAPLKELGNDPTSGSPIVLREGRFGPYVTDGTTNASLRRGDDPETITTERAVELLADRRAAGPPVKRARGAKKAAAGGGTTKKAAAKKTAAKKAVGKKAAAKKSGTKKAAAKKATARASAPPNGSDDDS